MLLFKLIKHWSFSSNQAHKLPQKKDKENIQRKQSQKSFRNKLKWMYVKNRAISKQFFKQSIAHHKG